MERQLSFNFTGRKHKPRTADITRRLEEFVLGCSDIHVGKLRFGFDPGARYARIWREENTVRVTHCFVDVTNGNVHRPKYWNRPDKKPLGNLYDVKAGLGQMGASGPINPAEDIVDRMCYDNSRRV